MRWNGSARGTAYISGTKLATPVSAGEIAAVATAQVTVFSPAPGGGSSNALTFTISSPQPIIEITMSKASYATGDNITVSQFHLSNPASAATSVEAKVWLSFPGAAPISILNFGSDGSVSLPANFSQEIGPLTLFAATTAGTYEFSSRVVNPVTGELLSEDLNPFSVAGAATQPATEGEAEADATLPSVDIALNQAMYTAGDTVMTTRFRLKNPGSAAVAVEVKIWRGTPNAAPTSSFNVGADGSFSLPAAFDQELGPITLFTVAANMALGNYEFSGRLLDPVTGKLYNESLNPFVIR